jgi:hypothetical protein
MVVLIVAEICFGGGGGCSADDLFGYDGFQQRQQRGLVQAVSLCV